MDMLQLHSEGQHSAATSLKCCRILVLDEADRMLDMVDEPSTSSCLLAESLC